MLVNEVMKPEAAVVSTSANIRQVLMVLSESDVRHVLIVDGDSLIGIVSDRELRAVILIAAARDTHPSVMERILSQSITRVMSTNVRSVNSDDELEDVIDLMLEHELGSVPVVETGTRKLIGVVSYVEALRVARPLFSR